jgi:phosphohistidine phosphatase
LRETADVIWLLRHGDAEDGGDDDAARRLTPKGEAQARAAGRALAALGIELDTCLASPKLRALDTARIACEALGVAVEECAELRGGPFDPTALTAGRGNTLLVGHEPDFSSAIGAATGANVGLKKGGLAAIEGALLVRLFRPPELRALARQGAACASHRG